MKILSYALGFVMFMAAGASAADYYIYQDYDGKIVITNRQPPSSVRIVLTYGLPDSPPIAASETIQPPATAETKEPDKAAETPAASAPRADAPVVETPVEPKEVIIVVPPQRDRRWPDHRRGARPDGVHDRR
jgi:hypothetical protein